MADHASSTTKTVLPTIHLLCMQECFATAFTAAVDKHWPDLPGRANLKIHDCSLNYLASEHPDLIIDAVVSPANSYARLDGAFDDALARVYGPKGDYGWITRIAQDVVYKKWRGFAPPGTCTIVPLNSKKQAAFKQPWATRFLLLCPTMAVPGDVQWDREVVYECIWSLLCAVEQHNQIHADETEMLIRSILMPPLATGIGRVKPERWAEQVVLAFRHWADAVERPEVFSRMDWEEVYRLQDEIEKTLKDDVVTST